MDGDTSLKHTKDELKKKRLMNLSRSYNSYAKILKSSKFLKKKFFFRFLEFGSSQTQKFKT